MFRVPDAAGGFYLAAPFGFAVGDAQAGGGGQRSFFDDEFDGGQATLACRVFAVADADQCCAEACSEAFGAGRGGREFLENDAACRCGFAVVGCGVAQGWRVDGYVLLPLSSGVGVRMTGRKDSAGECRWQVCCYQ